MGGKRRARAPDRCRRGRSARTSCRMSSAQPDFATVASSSPTRVTSPSDTSTPEVATFRRLGGAERARGSLQASTQSSGCPMIRCSCTTYEMRLTTIAPDVSIAHMTSMAEVPRIAAGRLIGRVGSDRLVFRLIRPPTVGRCPAGLSS